jgi:uncharacterized protein HemY
MPPSGSVASDLVNTATARYLKGDYPQAINLLQKAIKADPIRAVYYVNQINMVMAEQRGKRQRNIE